MLLQPSGEVRQIVTNSKEEALGSKNDSISYDRGKVNFTNLVTPQEMQPITGADGHLLDVR